MSEALAQEGILFTSCDDIYRSARDFAELYGAIAERVITAGEGTVFAVPGHPMFGEESVRIIAERVEIEVYPAPSFVDAVLAEAKANISGALQIWNAHEPEAHFPDPRAAQLIYQVDSSHAAADTKLTLMRFFPSEHEVFIVTAAGTLNAKTTRLPLSEMDRGGFEPLTTVFCPALQMERPYGFYGLVSIVDRLLGPGGCPWDREQTHETLKRHMLEETYEALEAIDSGDPDALCEELGDFLLQALMHSQMDAIEGIFDIDDVINGISDKLVRRHPHVFGDVSAATSAEVLQNWDQIKREEKGEQSSVLQGVPKSLPSLLRAYEVSKRAARSGFEWDSLESVFEKVAEEKGELHEAIASGSQERIESEFGDLVFSLVNVARWLKIEPEDALRKMVNRFTERFQEMESRAQKPLTELSPEEWESLWQSAKTN